MEFIIAFILIVLIIIPAMSSGICQEIATNLLLDTTKQTLKNVGITVSEEIAGNALTEAATSTLSSWSSWVPSLGTCVKIGAKVGATLAFGPFGGLAVDGVSVVVDVASGNYLAAGITVITAPLNFVGVPNGFEDAAKETAKDAAQDAAVEIVKEANQAAIKEVSKDAGKELGKQIAKNGITGVAKQEAIETTKEGIKVCTKQITKKAGQKLSEQIAKGQVKNLFQSTVKQIAEGTVKTTLSKTAEEAGKNLLKSVAKNPNNWKLVFEWFMKFCVN